VSPATEGPAPETLGIAGWSVARATDPYAWSLNELVFQAASGALADAGMTRADIDGVVLSASDALDGRAISSMQLAGPAGGYLRDEVKVTGCGLLALCTAALRLEAGLGTASLVVSWTKSSESPPAAALAVDPDPAYARPTGIHPWVSEAAVCSEFLSRHGLEAGAFPTRDVPNADALISWPLRTGHLPPPGDAAVAIVLTAQSAAVELAGWDFAWDADDPTHRQSTPEAFVERIAKGALADAGWAIADDSVIETTDRNPFRLAITGCGLGLFAPAEAPASLAAGSARLNPSGGLWSSNPLVAAGLERVVHAAEAVKRGDSASALAHSSFGIGGQGQAAVVVRGRG
jgi:acetyl-CoA acetyltransferase